MRRWLVLLVIGIVVVAGSASPAQAQGDGESITSYHIVVDINSDGSVRFTETVTYDFGLTSNHGIYRDLVLRQRYDSDYDRVYPFDLISVSSATAPADVDESDVEALHRLRIGDPDVLVNGVHTYEITYELKGTLNGFDDHDELYWNVVGMAWPVPIQDLNVEVHAPAPLTGVDCFAGGFGSTSACSTALSEGSRATFTQDRLDPYAGLTIVVGLPKGAVAEPAPVLKEIWKVEKAFSVTPFTVAASSILGLLVLGGVGRLLWVVGRDQRAVGSAIDVGFAKGGEPTQRVAFREDTHWPVEFAPPDNIRPGLIGTLADERVDQVDISATLIDLAVRGYLRIEQIDKKLAKDDYKLIRVPGSKDHALESYEAVLLTKLFAGQGPEVLLSDLRNEFHETFTKVQGMMEDEVVSRGWFDHKPSSTRTKWYLLGFLFEGVGVGLAVAAAAFTHLGLLAVPFVLGGLVLLIGAKWAPRRSAVGHGLLRRINGFERFIQESEKDRAAFAERQNLFSEFLPYAMVFGAVDKWANAFADLNGNLPATPWYVGPHAFTVGGFTSSVNSFAASAASTLTSTPGGSGGSGFSGGSSGGGGGGGGGGSW